MATPRSPVAALVFVNLDRFRSVNQMFGSLVGDMLLIEVGNRLTLLAGPHAAGRPAGMIS